MRKGIINSKSFFNAEAGLRIDPDIYLSEGSVIRNELKNLPYQRSTVGENAADVFCGNIFSRFFVSKPDHGMPYLSASDTMLADLDTGRYLSKKQASSLSYLMLKKDWILVTCSGTLGNLTYTNRNFENHIATHDLIRIIPNSNKVNRGTLYAFLSSKFGYYQITQSQFGGVVKHINAEQTKGIVVPVFPDIFQQEVDKLIQESAVLREQATILVKDAKALLKLEAGLPDLTVEDYNYFIPRYEGRAVSTFSRNIKELGTISFNAFNYSERVRINILERLKSIKNISFYDALDENKLRSPSGVAVTELKEGHGIMLINQSDIFNRIVKGKWVPKKQKYTKDLLEEGEILIAKIGTLGENETFCRCIYVGEELKGQLISSAFYRFKPSNKIPSGYLYAWLSSDYGFRLIRSSQYGTKQCYPNPSILYNYPVPIIDDDKMKEVDRMIKDAHHLMHLANDNERKAIAMVEAEIEKWNQ